MRLLSLPFYDHGDERSNLLPFGISFMAHMLLFAAIIYTPSWTRSPSYLPSVIDVQMVDLSDIANTPAPETGTAPEPVAVTEPPKPQESAAPVVETKSEAKPEVSVAPKRKSTKKAMKYKTFKKKKVIKNVIKQVEKKVDTQPPKPLEDTIKRLREKVAKEGKAAAQPSAAQQSEVKPEGKGGFFSPGSKKEIEVIDLYQLEIAYAVQKNWAFSQQLGGGKQLMASIVIKVLPDGEITDIFFIDRSGNAHLDDSAYKAIVKTSPVSPHPKGLKRPYIELGLRFTPEGVY